MTRAIARDPIYRRRRFQSEVIELCVRWYLTYRLSYRDLVEMMAERGIILSHSTILVSEQHRRAGPSSDQASLRADACPQDLSHGGRYARGCGTRAPHSQAPVLIRPWRTAPVFVS
jgi:hypothetical protein